MSTSSSASARVLARTLQVRSEAIPSVQGRGILDPVRLSGREGVNSLFEYELLLQTTQAFVGADSTCDLDLDSFIGREVSCAIELDGMGEFISGAAGGQLGHVGAGTRQINALVTDAQLLGPVGRQVQYRLILRPWLHLASLSTDCKVFQNKTVVEVIEEVLADYAFPVEKRLYGLEGARAGYYPQLDYCVQYNESDFAFFERLCQHWGISYHFEHAEGKHRLVLTDAMAGFRKNTSLAYQRVDYHPPGWKTDGEYLHHFAPEHLLTSGQYSSRDYDYTRPRADLTVRRAEPRPTAQAGQEVYQWHHGSAAASHYAQPGAGSSTQGSSTQGSQVQDGEPLEEGRHLALLRMQALRTAGARAQASGHLRGMLAGHTFELAGHPQRRANAEYLILDTRFLIEDVAQDTQAASGDGAGGERHQQWRYEVELTAHPVNEPLRPGPTRAKPHTHGPQTALVVGPDGQNIWTDALGRIKVQFPWDRLGGKNEHSSCWVRVSSPWAGNQLGGVHLPRIGQEVIVDFVGGDPDLPVCTGRVHNQVNLPPWSLPGQSALSGFRSRELTQEGGGNGAAGRSNHLVLDDTEGKIQAQLKSDHLHSEMNLGHIGRIQGNAGRQEDRGEGLELRTDGHGAVRAGRGLVLSTDAREKARGAVKDLGEPVQRLTRAREQHETLADLAEHHQAQDKGEDQGAVSQQLKAQNDEIRGEDAGAAFPELSQPHLVLSSPAGIQAATSGSTHLASGQHTAITSEAHTSIASGKSLLASALEAIRLFAHKAGIRIFAAKGPVQVQAQDDEIELIAKRAIELISTTDWIRLRAKEGISLQTPGNTFLIDEKGFRFYTPGVHHVWAGDHQTFGPKALQPVLPALPESVCIPCLLKAARHGSAISVF